MEADNNLNNLIEKGEALNAAREALINAKISNINDDIRQAAEKHTNAVNNYKTAVDTFLNLHEGGYRKTRSNRKSRMSRRNNKSKSKSNWNY